MLCGIWGTLAVGVLGENASWNQFLSQLLGVVAVGGFSFTFAMVVWYNLKMTVGIRPSEEEEVEGLDIMEHKMYASPEINTLRKE